jgi:hypothetical protein
MMAKQFLEILFSDAVQPGDLEITVPASVSQPGQVRLARARLGQSTPDAPNSVPLFSWNGAKIGFVAGPELMEEPFTQSYWIIPAAR